MKEELARRWRSGFFLVAACEVLAFVFGGASRLDLVGLAVVELASIPVLLMCGFAMIGPAQWRPAPGAFQPIILAAIVPLVQLAPLPPAIWSHLPGRQDLVQSYHLTGVTLPWRPISLFPSATWKAFVALAPPVAIYLGAMRLSTRERVELILIALGAAFVGLLLGAAQLAGGASSPFYLYPNNTNLGSAVGLFANRNHFADLLLLCIPLIAGVTVALRRTDRIAPDFITILCGLFAFLAVIGIGIARSRAGVLLLPVALIGAAVMLMRQNAGRALITLGAICLLGVVAVGLWSLWPLIERLGPYGSSEGRIEMWPRVLALANDLLPLGAGLGAFDLTFRAHEHLSSLDPFFLNHAHNEYLEMWLEAGWLGIAAIGLMIAWIMKRATAAWRGRGATRALAQAASIVLLILALHSFVDYPLRTEALATLAALALAVLSTSSPAPRPSSARDAG